MIKEENYINITGWMKTNLNLSGNKLLAFAIIFGFSQDDDSWFSSGVKYIADWLGCSYPTAISVLKELSDAGLIEKKEVTNEKGRFVNYRVVKNLNNGLLKNLTTPIKNLNNPPIKKFNTEIEDIFNNIKNNKIKEIIKEWVDYKKERKENYTPTGLKKCISRLENLSGGDDAIARQIVDNSIANNYSGLFPLKNTKTQAKETTWQHNMRVMREMEEENNANKDLF